MQKCASALFYIRFINLVVKLCAGSQAWFLLPQLAITGHRLLAT